MNHRIRFASPVGFPGENYLLAREGPDTEALLSGRQKENVLEIKCILLKPHDDLAIISTTTTKANNESSSDTSPPQESESELTESGVKRKRGDHLDNGAMFVRRSKRTKQEDQPEYGRKSSKLRLEKGATVWDLKELVRDTDNIKLFFHLTANSPVLISFVAGGAASSPGC